MVKRMHPELGDELLETLNQALADDRQSCLMRKKRLHQSGDQRSEKTQIGEVAGPDCVNNELDRFGQEPAHRYDNEDLVARRIQFLPRFETSLD